MRVVLLAVSLLLLSPAFASNPGEPLDCSDSVFEVPGLPRTTAIPIEAQEIGIVGINVSKTEDTDDGTCDHDCSLREAIAVALDNDIINIPPGTYTLTLGSALEIRKNLTLNGAGARATIVEAATEPGVATARVFTIANADVVVSGLTVRHGNSLAVGAGIYHTGSNALIIADSSIDSNYALNPGAGLYIGGPLAEVELVRSTVSNNVSQGGGAGIVNESSLARLTILNSTVSGNINTTGSSNTVGAGLNNAGTLIVKNSTITDNSANEPGSSGGGIGNFGSATLSGTVVSGNSADSGGNNCGGPNPIVDDGGNFDDDGSCGAGFSPMTGLDPLLEWNGGSTLTHLLHAGSAAIDQAGACGLATDQRRVPREDIACDSGSVEFPAVSVPPAAVPDGSNAPPLRVVGVNSDGTAVDLIWSVALCRSAGYHLIYGDLGNVSTYTIDGSECSLTISGEANDVPVPAGDLWFLVLGNDSEQTEGDWGDSTGGARNGLVSSGECGFVQRDNGGRCP